MIIAVPKEIKEQERAVQIILFHRNFLVCSMNQALSEWPAFRILQIHVVVRMEVNFTFA